MDPRSRSEKQFCAAQHGCWEQHAGIQEDQSVFLAAELSLQPAPLLSSLPFSFSIFVSFPPLSFLLHFIEYQTGCQTQMRSQEAL